MAGDGAVEVRRRRRRLGAVGVGLGLLVVTELLVRVPLWAPPSREEFNQRYGLISIEHYYQTHRHYFAEYEAEDGARVCGPHPDLARESGAFDNAMHWDRFPCDKPPGTLRILTLGGSSTMGWGVDPDACFSEVLERQLAARSSVPVEVINGGVSGHNTIQIREMLPGLLFLEPDVVLLYAGHNDYNFFLVADAAELAPRWVRRARIAGDHLALWRAARVLLYRIRPPRGAPERPLLGHGRPGGAAGHQPPGEVGPRKVPSSREARRELVVEEERARTLIEARYHENVREIARQVGGIGADLVLAAPVSRVDDGPLDSIHWVDLDDEQLARFDAAYALVEGPGPGERPPVHIDQGQAVADALALDDTYAHLLYMVGLREIRRGDLEAAREHLHASMDNTPPGRCDRAPPRHRAVVAEAAERVGAVHVDPWPVFEEAARRKGLPGEDLFIDSLHPTVAGHELLATRFADVLVNEGLVPVD